LYNGKTPYEFFGQFTDNQSLVAREWVHNYWNANHNTPDFETFWRKSVHDGFIADTQNAAKTVTAKAGNIPAASAPAEGMEIVFRPDSNIYDGRFANNGWLQELPRPITTITWDNAVYVSLNTARSLGIDVTDQQESTILELDLHGRKLESVAWVTPGVPDDSVTITLGYGRDQAGRTGNAHGYNAYLLRTSEAPLVASGLKLRNTLKSHAVASVHTHHNVSHEELGSIPEPAAQEVQRGIMRAATLEEFKKNPDFAHEKFEAPPMAFTLYKPQQHPYDPKNAPHKWGMAIDLNACIGCNTCVVACQSENNIPVVGQWEVRRGREMHWIRIDQYYLGDFANPEVHYMPVPCQQCENAPCEVVCPVGATVHSSEGLNDMVYNRCVGTRYCSNNCPYKVRRFNFMLYADYTTPQYKLMNNPDVTVRSRGVMEKCTYCIQRITHARIKAEELQVTGQGNGLVPDGSLKTACQQACPADAIVFGNMNDEKSRVNEWKAQPNNYGMLADLNTQPRTTYLAAVTNPNPALKSEAEQA
jgi:molybdopterin-containing oxidoreductase family iron-sulfur binding subunit